MLSGEPEFIEQTRSLVETIIDLRNKRGDLSHGKFVPKPEEIVSTTAFGTYVMNITDTVLSFMLDALFSVESLQDKTKLDYNEMKDYNDWLDENTVFPVTKVKYSQVLYEHDQDAYEQRYNDEFLSEMENSEALLQDQIDEAILDKEEQAEAALDSSMEDWAFKEDTFHENMFDEAVESASKKEKVKDKKEIEKLVANDVKSFWTKERSALLKSFCEAHELIEDKFGEMINNSIAFDEPPRRDVITFVMKKKPQLKDIKHVTKGLLEEILVFIKEVKK